MRPHASTRPQAENHPARHRPADPSGGRRCTARAQAGQLPGSNRPVEIAETELGALYRLALEQGVRKPRNAGEIAITEWLADELIHIGGPAMVVYENGRVPTMLSREGVAATVAVLTTRNLLLLAEEKGVIPDAEALWSRIIAAVPTANPASVRTFIYPETT